MVMSSRICPYVEGCRIFAYFDVKEMRSCLGDYCLGNFDSCQRRALRLAGEEVPLHLLPTGECLTEEPPAALGKKAHDVRIRTVI